MPAESVVVVAIVTAMFTFMSLIFAYGSSVAPPTFDERESAPRRKSTLGNLVEAN